MNDENREWLSALADGELQGQELERALEALRRDSQLQASWQSYHVMRDAVSSNLTQSIDMKLHQRISEALNSEPTILAPQRTTHPWLKHVAGVAIAASVTGVAIIGVQRMNVAGTAPAVAPVAQQQEYLRLESSRLAEAPRPKLNQNSESLTPYLVNHNEYSANSGIQGMLPYVRIVGHKADNK